MNRNGTDGSATAVISSAGLERKRLMTFASLCELLPADVHWGDPLTPAILSEVVMAIESREREACANVCDEQALEPECPERAKYCADAIRTRSNAGVTGAALLPRPG